MLRIVGSEAKRYEKYAAAQAWLTDTLPQLFQMVVLMLPTDRTIQPVLLHGVGTKGEPSTNTLKCPKMLSQQKTLTRPRRMVEEKSRIQ